MTSQVDPAGHALALHWERSAPHVGSAGVSVSTLPTQVSVAASSFVASPVTTQPPFASTLAIAPVNFPSALDRQSGSTEVPAR
jgi:hypothetical protein